VGDELLLLVAGTRVDPLLRVEFEVTDMVNNVFNGAYTVNEDKWSTIMAMNVPADYYQQPWYRAPLEDQAVLKAIFDAIKVMVALLVQTTVSGSP